MRIRALLAIAVFSLAGAAKAAEQAVILAGMKVTVWSGEEVPVSTPQPVIIFSHGFHGCATQSRFLTEAFASAGYLVFAPNHPAIAEKHRSSTGPRSPSSVRSSGMIRPIVTAKKISAVWSKPSRVMIGFQLASTSRASDSRVTPLADTPSSDWPGRGRAGDSAA